MLHSGINYDKNVTVKKIVRTNQWIKYATDKVLISFKKFLCHLKPPLAKRGQDWF